MELLVSPGASARFDHRPLAAEPLSHAPHNHGHSRRHSRHLTSASIVVWGGTAARPVATWPATRWRHLHPLRLPLLLWIDICVQNVLPRRRYFHRWPHDLLQDDIRMEEGSSTRADVVRTVARARRMRSRETTRAACSVLGTTASRAILFTDEMSKRLDALARQSPRRLDKVRCRVARMNPRRASKGRQRYLALRRDTPKRPWMSNSRIFDVLLAGAPYLHPPEGNAAFRGTRRFLVSSSRREKTDDRRVTSRSITTIGWSQISSRQCSRLSIPMRSLSKSATYGSATARAGPKFWLCDVVRTLDAIDEESATIMITILSASDIDSLDMDELLNVV